MFECEFVSDVRPRLIGVADGVLDEDTGVFKRDSRGARPPESVSVAVTFEYAQAVRVVLHDEDRETVAVAILADGADGDEHRTST